MPLTVERQAFGALAPTLVAAAFDAAQPELIALNRAFAEAQMRLKVDPLALADGAGANLLAGGEPLAVGSAKAAVAVLARANRGLLTVREKAAQPAGVRHERRSDATLSLPESERSGR